MKRLNVRMYCFRKLNYFHVDRRILALSYEVFEGIICYVGVGMLVKGVGANLAGL